MNRTSETPSADRADTTCTGRPWMGRVLVVVAMASTLSGWELLGRALQVRTDLLPTPSRILLEMWKEGPRLYEHASVTAYEAAGGFLCAVVLAIPFGFLMASFYSLHRTLAPFLQFGQILPLIATAPLLLAWFGFGTMPKVLMALLVSFPPIATQTLFGLLSIPKGLIDLTRAMGARKAQLFFKVKVPASLPYIFKGLRMAVALAVAGVTAAEFAGSDRGLGYLLLVAGSSVNTALLFAALTILALIATLLYYAITALERILIDD
jgi:NitT/TauT family transport system permease protein